MSSTPSFLERHRYTVARAIGIAAVVAILVLYDVWAGATAQADAALRDEAMAASRAGSAGPYATDGTFTGTAEGYGGPVTMQVTVENGWIASVEVLDASLEDDAWLDMASVLPERILEAQTPAIDVVSGATFTSTGMLNGVTEALLESMKGGEADEQ